jgi:outer membrane protein assembly factor BamB
MFRLFQAILFLNLSMMSLMGVVSVPALAAVKTTNPEVIWEVKEASIIANPLSNNVSQYQGKLMPVIDEATGNIYTANASGLVTARAAKTGKILWQHKTKRPLSAGPFYHAGKLYLGATDAKILAIDANSGNVLWQKEVSGEVLAIPRASERAILVSTMDGKLSALNAESGDLQWIYDRALPSIVLRDASSPVVHQDKALAGFSSGKLAAFDLESGVVQWEKPISVPKGRSEIQRMVDICADLVVDSENVYAASYQGEMVAVNIETGIILWQRDLGTRQNFSLRDGTLYVTDNQNTLWGIDAKTGATLWMQTGLNKNVLTGPEVIGNFILVADKRGYVHWIKKDNGELVGKLKLGKGYRQAAVVSNNIAYLTALNGQLTALMFKN